MMTDLSEKFQRISKSLETAKKIFITAHENPDPDAVGSVLALYRVFQEQNKEVFCYLPTAPPLGLDFLPDFSEINPAVSGIDIQDFDLLFCLDYGDFKRLRLPKSVDEKKIITIDHHLKSDQRGRIKIIEPKFSSTAEIIYLWLKDSGIKIDKKIATGLLTGIVSDTGGFSHASCSSQTLAIVSELILLGAPLFKISQRVFRLDNPQTASKIWGTALSRLKCHEKTGLVYSWLTTKDLEEQGAGPADLARISSFISTIPEAKFALFLTEHKPGEIEGSLRTEPYKGGTVAPLAEALGGGGHAYAAGFRQKGSIESVLKKVIKLLE